MNKANITFLSNVLSKHLKNEENLAFLFGSRVNKSNRKFSDFDIGIEGKKIPARTFFEIKSDFEESNFPYTVDVVDFNDVSESFKAVAKKNIIPIQL